MGRRTYDEEFKLEAVRLLESQERPLKVVADGLGLRAGTLRQWQLKVAANPSCPFPGSGRRVGAVNDSEKSSEEERLREENRQLRAEREELKRARDIAQQEREILKNRPGLRAPYLWA